MKKLLYYIVQNKQIDINKDIDRIREVYAYFTDRIEVTYIEENESYIVKVIQALHYAITNNVQKLVIISNNLLGPINSIEEIHDCMEEKDCDFWTLTKCGINKQVGQEVFFQFYYCVFNPTFFCKICKQKWIEDAVLINDELELSSYFIKHGIKGESYIDDYNLEKKNGDNQLDLSIEAPFLLIEKYKFPFIRFEALFHSSTFQDENQKIFKYISDNKKEDLNYIWEYILKSCNIYDIYTKLSLNYIIPGFCNKKAEKSKKRIALLAHLYYEDLAEECLHYIRNISDDIDIYISTGNDKTYAMIKEYISVNNIRILELRKIENRGRDVAALLYYCNDIWYNYEILGFIHDKKSTINSDFLQGEKYRFTMWENLLANKEYIHNIFDLFDKEQRLGLIIPPIPKQGIYQNIFWENWGENFENTKDLSDRLDLNVNIDRFKGAIALSTSFWCRTDALKKLFSYDFAIEELDLNPFPVDGTLSHAIERILPYVAQDAGYYTASVETREYAEAELSYYYKRMPEICYWWSRYDQVINAINPLLEFIRRYDRIYIYGCGNISNEITELLLKNHIEYEGYIVTKKEENSFYNKPIYSIDELCESKKIGIIVAVGIKNKDQIEKLLNDKGFDYFLWRQ